MEEPSTGAGSSPRKSSLQLFPPRAPVAAVVAVADDGVGEVEGDVEEVVDTVLAGLCRGGSFDEAVERLGWMARDLALRLQIVALVADPSNLAPIFVADDLRAHQ